MIISIVIRKKVRQEWKRFLTQCNAERSLDEQNDQMMVSVNSSFIWKSSDTSSVSVIANTDLLLKLSTSVHTGISDFIQPDCPIFEWMFGENLRVRAGMT